MTRFGIKKIPYGLLRGADLFKRHIRSFYKHNTPAKFMNLCLLYIQKWANKSLLLTYPVEIIIDPINLCHLRCPLCPTGQRVNSRPFGRMNFENFQRIIEELGRWLYKIRFYNWGEPLMHEDIYKMIAYATNKNISTELSTHLNLLSPADAQTLVESGLELLIISLDGADDKTYSHYRIGGDFDKVINNIKGILRGKERLGRKYPLIELQFLVMRHNESQIEKMEALAKELGVDRLRIGPVTVNIRNEEDWQWLPLDEKMSRYSYSKKRDKIYSRRKKCEWLWRSTVINWDGTVSPCCVYEGGKSDFGSLDGKRFIEIWNNEHYRHSREVFTRKSKRNNGLETICSHCRGIPIAMDEKQHGLY